jgi:hypothetical protein
MIMPKKNNEALVDITLAQICLDSLESLTNSQYFKKHSLITVLVNDGTEPKQTADVPALAFVFKRKFAQGCQRRRVCLQLRIGKL